MVSPWLRRLVAAVVVYILLTSVLAIGVLVFAKMFPQWLRGLIYAVIGVPAVVWLVSPSATAVYVLGMAVVGLLALWLAWHHGYLASAGVALPASYSVFLASYLLLDLQGRGWFSDVQHPTGDLATDAVFVATWGAVGLFFATAAPAALTWYVTLERCDLEVAESPWGAPRARWSPIPRRGSR